MRSRWRPSTSVITISTAGSVACTPAGTSFAEAAMLPLNAITARLVIEL